MGLEKWKVDMGGGMRRGAVGRRADNYVIEY